MRRVFCAWILLLFHKGPTTGSFIQNRDDGMSFLLIYGYLTGNESGISPLGMKQGILDFQKFYHLPSSGVLDAPTLRGMNGVRCSNPERMDMSTNSQISRATSSSKGWTVEVLRYSILNLPRNGDMANSRRQLEEDIRWAFALWESVANLSIVMVEDWEDAEIKISFVGGDHGDNMPFGERALGTAVAHAFFPLRDFGHHLDLEGDIHFDISQPWIFGQSSAGEEGVNFRQVCAHEIGHALGLEHSMEEDAVMHMLIRPKDNLHLHADDIIGIQNLYGSRREPENELNLPEVSHNHVYDDGVNSAVTHQQLSLLPKKPQFTPNLISTTLSQTYLQTVSNSLENFWFIKSFQKKEITSYSQK